MRPTVFSLQLFGLDFNFHVYADGGPTLEYDARHGGIVQLGYVSNRVQKAAGMVPAKASIADVLIMGVAMNALAVFLRRERPARAWQ